MVNSAPLLGVQVSLRSWRLDVMENELTEARAAQFAVPLIGTIRGILARNSVSKLAFYEIDDALFRSLRRTFDLFDNDILDKRLLASKSVQNLRSINSRFTATTIMLYCSRNSDGLLKAVSWKIAVALAKPKPLALRWVHPGSNSLPTLTVLDWSRSPLIRSCMGKCRPAS